MGRNNRRRQRFRNDRKQGEENGEKKQGGDPRRDYFLAPKESKPFEQYYKGQGIVAEEEYDRFIETLKQPLPCTFRVTGFTSHSEEMLRIIKGDFLKQLVNIEVEGKEVPPAVCLSWYPGELAWQLDLERKIIRRNDALKRLHKFLIQETESGNISRQEAVSMIPPLLLDVQSHHKVLDMCAAPGSKTAQLIEMLHAGCSEDTTPGGYVIANDADNKRCYLMVHQISRLASPQFLVTNMDASNLPNLYLRGSGGVPEERKGTFVKFDRILCDVPCSGDGTLRKNVDAWYKWNPNIAHGLHNLQVRILCRGLNLLATNGRLVYSTCSFNPVENEAVLVTVLKAMKGKFRLVDVSDKLSGLDRDKGMLNWKIMSKEGQFYEKYEDIPERLRTQIPQSAFPPTEDEARELGLDRCLRILPHKQNTGGFFVAVIGAARTAAEVVDPDWLTVDGVQGKTETAAEADESSTNTCSAADEAGESAAVAAADSSSAGAPQIGSKRKLEDDEEISVKPRSNKRALKYMGFREDPFFFIGENSEPEMWPSVREFFGIKSDFPLDRLMLRCEQGRKRNVYYVASGLKDLVQENKDIWKFINLGVKIFSRSESKEVACDFRLVQDGLHLLYPYITKRIVRVSRDDVVTLLSSETPFINRMTKSVQSDLNNISIGSCVFVYEPANSTAESENMHSEHAVTQEQLAAATATAAADAGAVVVPVAEGEERRLPGCRLVLCGWRGKVSCRSFLPKNERAHYLRLCGVELKEGSRDKTKHSDKSAETSTVAADDEEGDDDDGKDGKGSDDDADDNDNDALDEDRDLDCILDKECEDVAEDSALSSDVSTVNTVNPMDSSNLDSITDSCLPKNT